MDSLPGLGPTVANNLGQYLTVMVPDTLTFPGSAWFKMVASPGSVFMHSYFKITTPPRRFTAMPRRAGR